MEWLLCFVTNSYFKVYLSLRKWHKHCTEERSLVWQSLGGNILMKTYWRMNWMQINAVTLTSKMGKVS